MNFSNLITTQWLINSRNWLHWVRWAVAFVVVFLLAKTFWVWALYITAETEFKPISVKATSSSVKSQSLNVDKLLKRNLLGSVVKAPTRQPVASETVAPTRLNLKLRGIYAADTKQKANAIIEDNRGQQAVYFIDEKLNVSGRVFLRQVFADRIILETNGKREQLSLESPEMAIVPVNEAKKVSTSRGVLQRTDQSKKRVSDKRKDKRLTNKLNNYRKKILADPKSISEVIAPRPHFIDGELQGFKISAGKDKRLFKELGLRRNDLVTAINGVSLTNMQDAMTLMNEAKSLTEVTVDIQRDQESLSLLLNLNDQEGRQ